MQKLQHRTSDLLAIVLLASLLFGLFLGSRPLTAPDEGRYSEIPRQMLLHHDYVTPRINNIKYFEKPPLFYWLQSASFSVLGMNDWTFRLANALMGVLGCVITYLAGYQLYNRRTALLATMILATSALYFGLARFITLDMTLSVMLTGCLFSFIVAEHTGNKSYLWLMYIFAALATLTKGFVGVILPGAIIFLWLAINNKWHQLRQYKLFSGTLLFLVIALPWHILAQLRNPEFLQFYVLDQQILRYFTDVAGREQAVWFFPAVLVGGLLPWTPWLIPAVRTAWTNFRKNNDLRAIFLMIWPAFIFLFYWMSKSQLSPYILPILPALAMLIAHHLAQNKNSQWPEFGVLAVLAITLGIVGISKFGLHETAVLISLVCMLIAVIVAALLYRLRGLIAGLVTLAALFSVFLISLNFCLPKYDSRTIKELADRIKVISNPEDEIACYHYLYQELPVYLNHNVTIVQYYGELKFGIHHGDVSDVWISTDAFWQKWQGDKRMFVIMNIKDFRNQKQRGNKKLFLVARTNKNVLATNDKALANSMLNSYSTNSEV